VWSYVHIRQYLHFTGVTMESRVQDPEKLIRDLRTKKASCCAQLLFVSED
jgi:hypothetical protein